MKTKIELKFSMAHDSWSEVDEQKGVHFSDIGPDSIFFWASSFDKERGTSELDAKISMLPEKAQMPRFCPHSFKHFVPAKHAVAFLDLLITLTTEFYVSKNQFTDLIANLTSKDYLTPNQAAFYLEKNPVIYDRDDMIEDATRNKDADLALRIAQLFKDEKKRQSSTVWLLQALIFNKSHPSFATSENRAILLDDINTSSVLYLLKQPAGDLLLDHIASSSVLTELDFYEVFYTRYSQESTDFLNQKFIDFLAKSHSITTLHMSHSKAIYGLNGKFVDINPPFMTVGDVRTVANALRLNRSVKWLSFADQNIGNEGLIAIVNALIANRETQLQGLNVFCCGITEQGAVYLLDNIDKIPSLRGVNLYDNWGVSNATKKALEATLNLRNTPTLDHNKVGVVNAVSEATEKVIPKVDMDVPSRAGKNSYLGGIGIFGSKTSRVKADAAVAGKERVKSESSWCIVL